MSKKVNKRNIKILSAIIFIVTMSNIGAFAMENNQDFFDQEKNNECEFNQEKNNEFENYVNEYDNYTEIDTNYLCKNTQTTKEPQTTKETETTKENQEDKIEKPIKQIQTEKYKEPKQKDEKIIKTEMSDSEKDLNETLEIRLNNYKKYKEKFENLFEPFKKPLKEIKSFIGKLKFMLVGLKQSLNQINTKDIKNFNDMLNAIMEFINSENSIKSETILNLIKDKLKGIYEKLSDETNFKTINELYKSKLQKISNEYDKLLVDFINDTGISFEELDDDINSKNNNINDKNENKKPFSLVQKEKKLAEIKNEISKINSNIKNTINNIKEDPLLKEYMDQNLILNISKTIDKISTIKNDSKRDDSKRDDYESDDYERNDYERNDYEIDDYEGDDYERDDSENFNHNAIPQPINTNTIQLEKEEMKAKQIETINIIKNKIEEETKINSMITKENEEIKTKQTQNNDNSININNNSHKIRQIELNSSYSSDSESDDFENFNHNAISKQKEINLNDIIYGIDYELNLIKNLINKNKNENKDKPDNEKIENNKQEDEDYEIEYENEDEESQVKTDIEIYENRIANLSKKVNEIYTNLIKVKLTLIKEINNIKQLFPEIKEENNLINIKNIINKIATDMSTKSTSENTIDILQMQIKIKNSQNSLKKIDELIKYFKMIKSNYKNLQNEFNEYNESYNKLLKKINNLNDDMKEVKLITKTKLLTEAKPITNDVEEKLNYINNLKEDFVFSGNENHIYTEQNDEIEGYKKYKSLFDKSKEDILSLKEEIKLLGYRNGLFETFNAYQLEQLENLLKTKKKIIKEYISKFNSEIEKEYNSENFLPTFGSSYVESIDDTIKEIIKNIDTCDDLIQAKKTFENNAEFNYHYGNSILEKCVNELKDIKTNLEKYEHIDKIKMLEKKFDTAQELSYDAILKWQKILEENQGIIDEESESLLISLGNSLVDSINSLCNECYTLISKKSK